MTTLSPALSPSAPAAGTLVSADGRTLPLVGTRLVVRAAAGFASVRLVQTFRNPHTTPLHVTYQLPLPSDAAVGGFAFRIGEQRIQGEIDRRHAARARFEQAIASGRTAALLEQDRSSLFTQELGNVPPGATIEAEVDVDQPLAWLDGSWSWRFPTTVAPRYLGAEGRVPDAGRIAVDVVDPNGPALPPRCELELWIDDAVTGAIGSPSHALRSDGLGGSTRLGFAEAGGRVAMDRDVVVNWPVASPQVGVSLRAMRVAHGPLAGQAFGLLTLVPPRAEIGMRPRARDLIVLLDISGSMQGAPLQQAQQVTSALLRSLTSEDRIELIAFADRPMAWSKGPQFATPANVGKALQWVGKLQAGSSTEMHTAILEALAATRAGVQRQVVVVTDGQIGFEQEIVGTIKNGLPAASRVHVVGVGSAPNRTLTQGASRAGRGIELLLGVDEDPTPAVARLLARTSLSLVDELVLDGGAVLARAPQAMPDLCAGSPLRLLVQLAPQGGAVRLRGATADGAFVHTLEVPVPVASDDALLVRAFGRELVEDLEAELAATGDRDGVNARIEAIGLAHRISTRHTSWIAVTPTATVDPRLPQVHEQVPHQLPHGMSVALLGLRGADVEDQAEYECLAMPPAPTAAPIAMPSRSTTERRREAAPKQKQTPPSSIAPTGAGGPPLRDADELAEEGGASRADLGKAKKESLFDRLFSRRKPADGAGGGGPGGSGPTVVLRLRAADHFVFELAGLSQWQVPDRVTVVFADGSEFVLAIDASRTTADGKLSRKALVRLVLLAAAGLPNAVPVRLRLHRGADTLELPIA
ncbi:MAG: VWA domain-containing protein [Planctomycetes bacterium]|nr:VWA domain-containing protein [Planctomycetota bacterium]